MEVTVPLSASNPLVELEVDTSATVNFAMQQNNVPLVRRLRLRNKGAQDVQNVTLRVTSEPEFTRPWLYRLDWLPAQDTHDVRNVGIQLSAEFLASLTEAVKAYLNFQVCSQGQLLSEKHVPIEILAYDQWNGLRSLPELLAAFVMPNHPAVEQILRQAADILGKWTGDTALSGYQYRDAARARLQAAAIYEAVRIQGIAYSGVPASFEERGQKVRTPDRILDARLGNCLDLSVLLAACIEQAGMHPLICIIEEHAFVGLWLIEDNYSDPVVEEPTAVKKRADLGEICVFEATGVTENQPFKTAEKAARSHFNSPERFLCCIDIHRARCGGVRPLPARRSATVHDAASVDVAESEMSRPAGIASDEGSVPPAPDSPESEHIPTVSKTPEAEKTPADSRIEQWKGKLLDLTLRNPLLNFRETKRTIPLLLTNLSDLSDMENALAEGRTLSICPQPSDWVESERDPTRRRQRTGEDVKRNLLLEELKRGRLLSALDARELQRRLIEIYRTARTSLEESGANTVYLALGNLIWYEQENPDAPPRRAPLLLIPIEIQRHSARSGFTIERRDDDAAFNITLLEKLHVDYDIKITDLESLPEDEAGIDVPAVFRMVREAIKHQLRWDVEERAYIGHLSFTKFLMWRDLVVRTEELKRNKLVASLIHFPHQPFPAPSSLPSEETLDKAYKPLDTFCPLSADSSQFAAIYAATEGNTFVLHGPPGTGKSQTITNIIAQALGQGKTVLFVAEKMAALNVVQRRLAESGLEDFCLELHSNKSKKAEVIRQLSKTLELAHTQEPEKWSLEARRLGRLRTQLNMYVEALHRPRKSGESYFTGISRLIQHRNAPEVKLDRKLVASVIPDTLQGWRDQVRSLVGAGQAVGHPFGHPWSGVHVREWSADLRDDVHESIQKARSILEQLLPAVEAVKNLFGLSFSPLDKQRWDVLVELTNLVLNTDHRPGSLISAEDWGEVQEKLDALIKVGRERDRLRADLYVRFNERLIQIDLDRMTAEWNVASRQWFLPKWLTRRRILKELRQATKPGQKLTAAELDQTLSLGRRLRDAEAELARAHDLGHSLLGRLWADGEADWDAIQEAKKWADAVRRLSSRLTDPDPNASKRLRGRWGALFIESGEAFQDGGLYTKQLAVFHRLASELNDLIDRLRTLLVVREEDPCLSGDGEDYLNKLQSTLTLWEDHIRDLRTWCMWQKQRADAIDRGLEPIVEAYEKGLPHDEVGACFERSYYKSWLDVVLEEDEILRDFSRHIHEKRIKEFRELDDRFRELTKQMLRARLLARVPQSGTTPHVNSEVGILRREARKQTRHIPIRALFNRIPNLITRLKPCLLMSPISVAQYLDPSFPPFDLVIFDEASQIPTWDAVGAIARGKEVIIVGDPKQLPPTNFFNPTEADDLEYDDDEYTVRDLESILDECLALNLPQFHLKWHYRSRHEALIAFSNSEYYENKLYTFPSPQREPAVQFRYVEGVYDRSGSRTNKIEAENVVDEVVRRLTDPALASLSIGIVTFNLPQQRLIEDLLDEARRRHPEIEPYFSPGTLEPVFVKNLENVQGDERDVIIFSIGYGPDATGRLTMTFGPLNRDGGQRRLNVAITRARQELLVFSSLLPEQIDLSRTQQRGVRDLKTFLEYAQEGAPALNRRLTVTDAEPESPFEEDVMKALQDLGYEVVPQVGCSGYRIDLAVVDPRHSGRFVLGIECDGAMYHSAKTARDRDKLREEVLRDLGWKIHRIWSTDWWQNRAGELERLKTAIQEAILTFEDAPPRRSLAPETQSVEKREQKIAGAFTTSAGSKEDSPVKQPPELPVYQLSMAKPDPKVLEHDFYSRKADKAMRRLIEQIVCDEGPISLNMVARRIAEWWGLGRTTKKAQRRIANLLSRANVKTVEHGDAVFLWPKNVDPNTYIAFRVPAPGEAPRDPQDLPPEEIAAALLHIMRSQVGLPRDDLVREGARLLGFQRTGTIVERCIVAGLELLEKRGMTKEINGLITEA
jgi:very-short-patch-repair endonuclease